ncbi:unnamed protein product [Adineta steineri]|uniref:Uncharacterized protein n=1 Tax=Adineta steineri TaxID=433720 RepID=A0A814Z9B7_9BILA|nr:unnamed protein product [Adineta steineri]CAF1528656.1 unnamed protein product [Adineta steineri]
MRLVDSTAIDGQRLENNLVSNLPHLERFNCNFWFVFPSNLFPSLLDVQMYLDKFKTDFWISSQCFPPVYCFYKQTETESYNTSFVMHSLPQIEFSYHLFPSSVPLIYLSNKDNMYHLKDVSQIRVKDDNLSAEFVQSASDLFPNLKHITFSNCCIISTNNNWNGTSIMTSVTFITFKNDFPTSEVSTAQQYLKLLFPNATILLYATAY